MSATKKVIKTDILCVGAGIASLSTALALLRTLKKLDKTAALPRVTIIEKGRSVGSHVLSGTVIDPSGFEGLLTDEELAKNRVNMWQEFLDNPLDGPYYRARSPDFSKSKVPLLSAANWGGQGLHLRGNIEGFTRSASTQKWLEVHGGAHWAEFYTDYGVDIQKRFFNYFLKGKNNGWDQQPAVQLNVRHIDKFVVRTENDWPIARTQWTKFHLNPGDLSLSMSAPADPAKVQYEALGDGVTFMSAPLVKETEITGPSVLRLNISSETTDADIFAVLRVFNPQGKEVVFHGALDPNTPIGQGWLRASQRKLDAKLSLAHRPYYTHDEIQTLAPGQVVALDVEIWPTCIVVPVGYRIGMTIRGKDYEFDGPAATLSNMKNPMKGCGPFVHDDAADRPAGPRFGKPAQAPAAANGAAPP